jgi:hypothetical protein
MRVPEGRRIYSSPSRAKTQLNTAMTIMFFFFGHDFLHLTGYFIKKKTLTPSPILMFSVPGNDGT